MSKSRFSAGRFVRGKGIPAGFAVSAGSSRPVLHAREPDPDADLTSDRIAPVESRVPTPPELYDELGPSLTASLIHGALVQWGDGTTEVDQVAQVIAGAIRLEAERIAERERDKVLVVVRQLTDTVQVLVEALERDATRGPKGVA